MSSIARLVGFCQGMPDVLTFVTPILLDDAVQPASCIGTALPRSEKAWQYLILDHLGVDHSSSLDGHQETIRRIEYLVGASETQVDAKARMEAALTSVVKRTELAAGTLSYLS